MLDPKEIENWQRLGTATTSDAMEELGFRRSVVTGLRCTAPDKVAVGIAFTMRQMLKHASAGHSERLVKHAATIRTQTRPGDFVVMDAGGFTDLSSWGELHSRHCVQAGIAGLLIDGCIRDAAKIRRLGFAAYCRGFTPIKSQWDYETVSIGEPVMIGRVQIRPGDLIVADEDGAIVVPFAQRLEVLEAGLKIADKEDASAERQAG
ncbi:dimethylmenaquinone methyltransferase [Pigmentiphaga soli]|uniref:Putative 4-hydroxy-4-methyl-2-oxoglutarate aldolase n=1 Tax=Pigmentiphaga soli TaxID=1007095 RepID=A0ABP8HMP9_9BURK